MAGAGLAGAANTSSSPWIEVRQIKNPADLTQAKLRFGLGIGELSTMILAKEVQADLIIFDDLYAKHNHYDRIWNHLLMQTLLRMLPSKNKKQQCD